MAKPTPDLIERLVADLPNRSAAAAWGRRFTAIWALVFTLGAAVTIFIAYCWPAYAYLPDDPLDPRFLLTAGAWLFAFATFARLCYLQTIPLARTAFAKGLAGVAMVLLAVCVFQGETWLRFASEISIELDWERGPCGFLILSSSALTAAGVLFAMRRAVPSRSARTGAVSVAAAGSLSTFFMQLICRHESSAHAVLWHALPILVVAGFMSFLAPRIAVRNLGN